MPGIATFHENPSYKGDTRVLDNFGSPRRWRAIRFGSAFSDEASSFKVFASGEGGAHVFAFTTRDFGGAYVAVNVPGGQVGGWPSLPKVMDDNIESAIIFERSRNEYVNKMSDYIGYIDGKIYEKMKSEKSIKKKGTALIYGIFSTKKDPNESFLRIEIPAIFDIKFIPDYFIKLRFDIKLSKSGKNVVGYCKWYGVWVEGGLLTWFVTPIVMIGLIFKIYKINQAVKEGISQLSPLLNPYGVPLQAVYILPGTSSEVLPSSPDKTSGPVIGDCCVVTVGPPLPGTA